MFNKNKFALILKNINDTYSSQRDFSKKSEINRTYLSQYMNMKLEDPPKPKILKKLAENSNGITTYNELMQTCGYINNNFSEIDQKKLSSLYEQLSNLDNVRSKDDLRLSFKESQICHSLFNQVLKYLYDSKTTPSTFNSYEILDGIDFVSDKSKKRIAEALRRDFEYFYYTNKIEQKILNIKGQNNYNEDSLKKESNSSSNTLFYMCPLYNEILSEEPYWLDNNIKGRIVLDTSIYNINKKNDYFSIEVNENYTNFRNTYGHYIIFQKQNSAKDDDIILTIIENSKPCIRKYKKLSNTLVMLQPIDFTDVLEPLVIDITNTAMSILGTAIGYFGKMETK